VGGCLPAPSATQAPPPGSLCSPPSPRSLVLAGEGNRDAPPRLIRAAESDADATAIFRFLCQVATPLLHCPIDPEKSFTEVRRVVADRDYGFAYMALEDGMLVGTLGAIFVSWWYGEDHFFTDRWFFSLPGHRWAGPRLLAEADAIARAVGVPLIVNLKQRRTTAAVTFVKPELLGEDRRVG
jgi:GNAT superfamily N-acetyltransferase